ncbi:hypothetical protein EDD16DRAFT_1723008 [Pisolithus croceorrhizus]|nr:hypothetical protein EDD16DRAFT_1723008 [Pisolithus croceorrhizus]
MSSLTTVEGELEVLYDNLRQIRLLNYVTLSCLAFLVYDILTNLDKEIPLIWRYYHNADGDEQISWRGRARRILVQTLFIFGRYYAPLFLVGFFAVNNHQGFSIPLYAFALAGFADANDLTPKAARIITITSFSLHWLAYFVTSGGDVTYSILVNIILAIRHNAMYQIFYGTEGLRKRQVFLASVVITSLNQLNLWFAVIIVCATTATWVEKRVIKPPAGIPWPGCMLSENPNTALTIPAWIISILVSSWSSSSKAIWVSCFTSDFPWTHTSPNLFEHEVKVQPFRGFHDLQH